MKAETLKRLWSVDNAYILIVLRFGYLGCGAFCVMAASAAFSYGSLAQTHDSAHGMFGAAMASVIVATLVALLSVWMPHDFGFWFIWTIGTAAGLRAHN